MKYVWNYAWYNKNACYENIVNKKYVHKYRMAIIGDQMPRAGGRIEK